MLSWINIEINYIDDCICTDNMLSGSYADILVNNCLRTSVKDNHVGNVPESWLPENHHRVEFLRCHPYCLSTSALRRYGDKLPGIIKGQEVAFIFQ